MMRKILRILQATKFVSIILMVIAGKAALDLIGGFSTGTLTSILWVVSFNPSIRLVNGVQWVIFIYVMAFGYFFTGAMTRVLNAYAEYFQVTLFNPLLNRIFNRKPEAKE